MLLPALSLAAGWFIVLGNIALAPPLLAFVAADLRMSGTEQGAFLVALPLTSFLGNVLFGPFVDRIGRSRSLTLGAAGAMLSLLGFLLVDDATTAIALRGVTGLLMPLVGISVLPCVTEYFPAGRRLALTGYVMASGSLAQMVMAPLAITLASHASWRWGFGVLAAVAGLAAAGALVSMPNRPRDARPASVRHHLRSLLPPKEREVRFSVIAFYLFVLGLFSVTALYPTWLLANLATTGDDGGEAAGVLFLVAGVAAVAASSSLGAIPRRWQRHVLVASLLLPSAVALALPAVPGHYGAQVALYTALVGLQSVASPVLRARINQLADEDDLSTVNASLNAGYQLAAATATAVAAVLYGLAPSFWLNSAVAAAGFLAAATAVLHLLRRPTTS
ncbi:MFS transporter [Streptomyces sp. NPDC058052]|uniref:MFS transporter n=1 Tax=Streptomyces sp. NPDC058052 TaxID=3346316 RepID=UPI0036E19A0E